ncbi:protein SAWADEE HOMEODOMAIN HOMOLOG 1 [Macadamia integrifolia]|uniref:protein SAWADEE HOMEODOMAIN HOMOLOG 1 n=1 Tax=Macadamia integrifolia TaxID=60698 RepID=UPI001C4F9741|nr:protein SAWADEE HOMEODOMAIN HOMOLOG 1 [Macadamia integrifolia]
MVRLRPRKNRAFSGFTEAETARMEELLKENGEESLKQNSCCKLAKSFNCSAGRAGKSPVTWKQIQSWLQNKQQDLTEKTTSSPIASNGPVAPPHVPVSNGLLGSSSEMAKVKMDPDLSNLEFEARSSKDGAWYDVAKFVTHRVLPSGETEVRVRFIGFGAEDDEWVNVKKAVRERSLPLEPSECRKVKVGDLVLCFQERTDQSIYYDAHVSKIQRRLHDIRGCRCIFLIRYDHDNIEESVRLRRLCRRPSYYDPPGNA